MAKRSASIVNLSEPVQHGEETIKVLEIRKPTAADMRDMPVQNQTMGHMMDLAANLTGHPPSVINQLAVQDVTALMEVVAGFMEPGQTTGQKSSPH
jgi:hypothetical protein